MHRLGLLSAGVAYFRSGTMLFTVMRAQEDIGSRCALEPLNINVDDLLAE